jgi:hypothetical protein
LGELLKGLRSGILHCRAYETIHLTPVGWQERRELWPTLIINLVTETLHYNVSVHRAYTSGFKGLANEFCRKRRLPSTPEQWEEVFLLDG